MKNIPDNLRMMQVASRRQILDEYRRREVDVTPDIYAPWNPAEMFALSRRRCLAAEMLQRAGKFPKSDDRCLEVGHGKLGWLADLISWGVPAGNLYGIELDTKRAEVAQHLLPSADLRIGDATEMPWGDGTFQVVVVSTVFSSLLDPEIRKMLAQEITRVLAPGGTLICYDFTFNNPRNPNVQKLTRRDIAQLFPGLSGEIRSVSLAPPIARRVVPRCWWFATFLEIFPFLRTHLMAVLTKQRCR